jgi:hypothetical protein
MMEVNNAVANGSARDKDSNRGEEKKEEKK